MITLDVAREHLKDGSDCIAEAMKSVKRVQKNFPSTNEKITLIEDHLKTARTLLQETQDALVSDLSPKS